MIYTDKETDGNLTEELEDDLQNSSFENYDDDDEYEIN